VLHCQAENGLVTLWKLRPRMLHFIWETQHARLNVVTRERCGPCYCACMVRASQILFASPRVMFCGMIA
jgi:hypothetical protein